MKWNPEQNFEYDNNKIHVQCQKNVKLIDEAFKERLKSVSLVITSLLTSLHDTSMEGMNNGFKIASDKFERIINSSGKILKSTEKILQILLEGHHNTIVIVGASTVAVLIILVLVLVIYMIKLAKQFKQRSEEADKGITEIKELKSNWSNLEMEIKTLVQEINQV